VLLVGTEKVLGYFALTETAVFLRVNRRSGFWHNGLSIVLPSGRRKAWQTQRLRRLSALTSPSPPRLRSP